MGWAQRFKILQGMVMKQRYRFKKRDKVLRTGFTNSNNAGRWYCSRWSQSKITQTIRRPYIEINCNWSFNYGGTLTYYFKTSTEFNLKGCAWEFSNSRLECRTFTGSQLLKILTVEGNIISLISDKTTMFIFDQNGEFKSYGVVN